MWPFPSKEKLAFFVGLELSNVTLQPYSLDFLFTDGTRIQAEYMVEYADGEKITVHDIQADLGPINFHPLIREQARVLDIDVTEHRLTLLFAGNRSITILSVSPGPYESGNIGHVDGLIVF
jgi:hypothetical protein